MCDHVNKRAAEEGARRPVEEMYFYGTNYSCPRCGEHLGRNYDIGLQRKNFCHNCGLALDWDSVKV